MLLDTTPDVVNNRLIGNNGYLNGNLVIWGKIPDAFPGVTCRREWAYNNTDVKNNVPCIVQVDGTPIGGTIHFVVYIGNGQLVDPWDGQVKPTSTYTAQSYAVIKGTWTAPQDQQEIIDQLRTERDRNWNWLKEQEQVNTDLTAQLEVVKGENERFKKELEERQNAINTLNLKIQTLTKAIEQDSVNDHDMGVKLLEVEKEVTTLRNFMADIGLQFGCPVLDQSDSEMYDCIIKQYKERLEPDKQTVKEWEKLLKAFEDSAIYKRVPTKFQSWFQKLLYWLR
jgi:hypothetical protein